MGNIIYLLLEFQNYVNRQQRNCDSGSFGWATMLRICFTIFQTYVLFKYPKVRILYFKVSFKFFKVTLTTLTRFTLHAIKIRLVFLTNQIQLQVS